MIINNPGKIADSAKSFYLSGDYPEAARVFSEAAAAYESAGDALMAAEMQNNRSVALLKARQPEAALEAARGTDKIFSKTGDHKREGVAFANQGAAWEAMKKTKEAIAVYQKAANALEKAGEGDMRAEVMQLLSMLYFRRWKFYDAIISLQSGLAGVKEPTPKQKMMKKILRFRV
jgi:tetratricopeptide (TPR) repeat protein